MPKSHLLKNWVPVSALFHLTLLVLASMIPWTPHRPTDVMVVDLTDLPRSAAFPPPPPGIVGSSEPTRVPRTEETSRTPGEPSEPSVPAPLRSLREITPSLGKMVIAKADPGTGRGEGTSSGNAVGTGGKAVEKGAISEERGGGAHLTALNAPEIQYISYFASIKRKIELVWQYPHDAATAGIQGELTVDFVIGRNGGLESLELLQCSGDKNLDDEALGSIRKAAPYNPIPVHYEIPNLRIRAHFIYEMHTVRIR